jgi:hypothetical protein
MHIIYYWNKKILVLFRLNIFKYYKNENFKKGFWIFIKKKKKNDVKNNYLIKEN